MEKKLPTPPPTHFQPTLNVLTKSFNYLSGRQFAECSERRRRRRREEEEGQEVIQPCSQSCHQTLFFHPTNPINQIIRLASATPHIHYEPHQKASSAARAAFAPLSQPLLRLLECYNQIKSTPSSLQRENFATKTE